jgi:hypothetical protein
MHLLHVPRDACSECQFLSWRLPCTSVVTSHCFSLGANSDIQKDSPPCSSLHVPRLFHHLPFLPLSELTLTNPLRSPTLLLSRTSQRRSFGLTNQAAQRSGKRGTDCRGEEHVVELVYSMVSKKTRVFWNKTNVSNLFRNSTPRSGGSADHSTNSHGSIEFSWQTRGGETVQIVANSESVTGTANLFIDGTNFDSLPHISDLGCSSSNDYNDIIHDVQHPTMSIEAVQTPSTLATETQVDGFDDGASTESMSDLGLGDPLDAPRSVRGDDLGYRLSMVGLSSGGLSSSTTAGAEPADELYSERYSSMLDTLRSQLMDCLPQTEEMISRAIIQAFFSDCSSSSHDDMYSSSSGSCGVDNRDQQMMEADALWEAREWVSLNVDVAPRPDVQELALRFMQKQIEGVFVRVRNDDISSEEAARQLLSVAAVLGLSFNNTVPVDTIILVGLDKATPVDEFLHVMAAFGPIQAAAISSRGRDFAFCRFMDESAVNGVQEAAMDGRLQVGGSLPYVSVVAEKLYACDGLKTDPNTRERRDDDAPSAAPPSLESDVSGHESANIFPHLMGPLSDDDGDLEEAEYMGGCSSYSSTLDHHHHREGQSVTQAEKLIKSRTESTSSLSPSSYRTRTSLQGSPSNSFASLGHLNLKSHSHHNLGRGGVQQHHGGGGGARPRFV